MISTLRKYPVTAPSGRQYEVTVERRHSVIDIGVYKRVSERTMFGRVKTYSVLVYNNALPEESVTDVISCAKRVVMTCEERAIRDEARVKMFKAFDAWDGVIKQEVSAN